MATIEARDLAFTYPDGTEAVRGVSFQVNEGEFFGFLGPNGAGKTTTIQILVTLLRPTGGAATVNGLDVVRDPVAVRSSVGYTAQDTSVDPELTGRENLRFACDAYRVPRHERAERIAELLKLVDLAEVADKRADGYSGGMRKRLDIATSLVHRPPLAFLDEPTTGLDPRARLGLWEHLERLNRGGTTMFLTTQYMDEADRLCDRIAIIDQGRIVAIGTPAALKAQAGGDTLEIHLENALADELERARSSLRSSSLLKEAEEPVGLIDEGLVVSSARARRIGPELLVHLKSEGFVVTGFNVRSPSLDDVFLRLTGGTLTEAEGLAGAGHPGQDPTGASP